MSLIFGKKQKTKPQFTGLSAQTSTSNIAIPLYYGKNRGSHNIIWQGDFKSHKHKQGKGMGGGSTTYTYSASFICALCWGPGINVTRVWKDQSKETSYAALGFTLFEGTTPQDPWGYMSTAHPDQALGYPGISYLATANYDLGQSNSLQQHSFEIEGLFYGTQVGGDGDADPAQVIEDFLANPTHGVGFDFNIVDQTSFFSGIDAETTGDSAYQTYCRAMGFGMSPFLDDQENASDIIKRWAMITNSAIAWTGYSLKFHPYGADTVTGNGVTYNPDFPVRYQLSDNDFKSNGEDEDPITFNRVDPADASNGFSINISNKNNEYNDLPVPWRDQGLVDQYGYRKADPEDAREITDPDMAAVIVSLIGQRRAYVRNSFEFTLGPQFALLEPMDVLECTDPRFGTFNVLITDIEEDDDDNFKFTAEEFNNSVSVKSSNSTQGTTNNPINTAVSPGPVNPPIIFEPPASLSGSAQIWASVSGGDGTTYEPNWGGAFVWLSTDGVSYQQIGEIDGPTKQGKLTAILATYASANPDTAHTLAVTLLMSNGELSDTSATDAAAGATVCYVDGELIGYEVAALTGTNTYNLTNLWRGLFGSTIGAHSSGTNFARLDENTFKYDLPAAYVGVPLYLKFQSFNIFGGGTQDLDDCVAYVYTPTGKGFGTGTAGVPETPTGLAGTAGSVFSKLTWNANSVNDNVTGYEIWRATGASQPFGSASMIDTAPGSATAYTDAGATAGQAYTYFIRARNAVGVSSNTSGVNVTPLASTASQPFGFAFTKTPVANKILAVFDTPIGWTIPAGLTDAQGTLVDSDTATAVAPSSQTDFDIQSPLGTSIGTMRFATSATTATFVKASSTAIPLGQPTYIVSPSNLNGMVGTITGSIKGTR